MVRMDNAQPDDDMTPDTDQTDTLARLVANRRAELRLSQQALADVSGVSVSTIQVLERGTQDRFHRSTLRGLSLGLRWPETALIDYLDSGVMPGTTAPQAMPLPSTVGDAILADPTLSPHQRRILFDLWREFDAANRQRPSVTAADETE